MGIQPLGAREHARETVTVHVALFAEMQSYMSSTTAGAGQLIFLGRGDTIMLPSFSAGPGQGDPSLFFKKVIAPPTEPDLHREEENIINSLLFTRPTK